ncbi:MAG: heparinase II/III family protein [Eubacteriales bacterium]
MIRTSYTFANSAQEIRRIAARLPDGDALLRQAHETSLAARTDFADQPERLSGWGHNFVCPKCASQMKFDVRMPYSAPNTYVCPHCGTSASGKNYDEAWVYYYRSTYAQYLESVALCAVLGDAESLSFLIRYMDFYAGNYERFPVHGEHAGRGKVMGQSLDEAVWGIALIRAVCICGELIPAEKKDFWYKKLFLPMAELLMPQSRSIDNIQTWLKCCIGMISICFGDEALLSHALDSEFGLRAQIREGFTADGIWRECSLLYHYYTLEALTNFFSLYALRAPDDPLFSIMEKMYAAPFALSFEGQLPALNDGWYPLPLAGKASLILRAARISEDSSLARQLDFIRETHPEKLRSIPALLYGCCTDGSVLLYKATNLALMKRPFHIILKSGVLCHNHRHRDYLSVVLPPFSDDIGTPGYGHPMTGGWYRLAPVHNTVCVDEDQPSAVIASHVEQIPDGVRAVIEEHAWSGLRTASRSLTADGEKLHDVTILKGEGEHVYDWIFHSIGQAEYSCAGTPASPFGEKNGYAYFSDIRKMDCGDVFCARFTLTDGRRLLLTVPDAKGYEIYTARSPGNPADNLRCSVILRKRAADAVFTVHYEQSGQPQSEKTHK